MLARKNPHSLHVIAEALGDRADVTFTERRRQKYLLTAVPAVLLGLIVLWLGVGGSPAQLARDFEECVEQVEAKPALDDERKALLTGCNARFAGRRKVDGGYIYYDFMQVRRFDIAGPNPTAEEHKQIDHAHMGFLDAQGREAVSAAKRQNEQLTADLESARGAGLLNVQDATTSFRQNLRQIEFIARDHSGQWNGDRRTLKH